MKAKHFFTALVPLLFFASAASASICQIVQSRIGEGRVFQNFIQNSETHPTVTWKKSGDRDYLLTTDTTLTTFRMRDYGLLCLMKSQTQTLMLSVPNEKGECWVSMARISQIVPKEREADFIQGGFCVSPFSWSPEDSWHGTSAMSPLPHEGH